MDRRNDISLAIVFCAAFVLYCANEIIFLNLRPYNLLSITMACIALLRLAKLYLSNWPGGSARVYAHLVLIFLAGISIKIRPKYFLFLAVLFFLVAAERTKLRERGLSGLIRKEAAVPIAGLLIAATLFILSFKGAAPLWIVLALSLALLGLEIMETIFRHSPETLKGEAS